MGLDVGVDEEVAGDDDAVVVGDAVAVGVGLGVGLGVAVGVGLGVLVCDGFDFGAGEAVGELPVPEGEGLGVVDFVGAPGAGGAGGVGAGAFWICSFGAGSLSWVGMLHCAGWPGAGCPSLGV